MDYLYHGYNFCYNKYNCYFHPEMKDPSIPPKNGACGFDTLPEELFVKIFANLDDETLKLNIPFTNTTFKRIGKSNELCFEVLKIRWASTKQEIYNSIDISEIKTEIFFEKFLACIQQNFLNSCEKKYHIFIKEKIHKFTGDFTKDLSENYQDKYFKDFILSLRPLTVMNARVKFMSTTIKFLEKETISLKFPTFNNFFR